MKMCTKCKINKSLDEFNNLTQAPDGKKTHCRECTKKAEKLRQLKFEAAGRPEVILTGTKECTKCKVTKPYSEFYRRGDASGTYKSQCKACLRPVLNKYKKDNPAKRSALKAKRRAAIINRTPSWLTEDDYWLIEQAYQHAIDQEKIHGIKFHVDHIIPLQGKYISGLHCPDNLQVITEFENCSKNNRFTNEGIQSFINSLTQSQLKMAEDLNITIKD